MIPGAVVYVYDIECEMRRWWGERAGPDDTQGCYFHPGGMVRVSRVGHAVVLILPLPLLPPTTPALSLFLLGGKC